MAASDRFRADPALLAALPEGGVHALDLLLEGGERARPARRPR